jgi:hypothetical protein
MIKAKRKPPAWAMTGLLVGATIFLGAQVFGSARGIPIWFPAGGQIYPRTVLKGKHGETLYFGQRDAQIYDWLELTSMWISLPIIFFLIYHRLEGRSVAAEDDER